MRSKLYKSVTQSGSNHDGCIEIYRRPYQSLQPILLDLIAV